MTFSVVSLCTRNSSRLRGCPGLYLESHGAARRLADRPLRPREGNRPPRRHPGPGPRPPDAEGSRRGRRPRHRRLRHRLPRLAARRRRPADVEGRPRARGRRHQVRARPQRGPRRHRALGQPAGQPARRGPGAGRLRPLVRQGPGRRPLRRRLPPRQHGRHRRVRRRRRLPRRRPHRRELDRPAPLRVRARRCDDAHPLARGRAGGARLRPPRLGALALHRLLGRPEMRQGHDRGHPGRRRRPAPPEDRHARRLRHAGGRPQHPPRRHPGRPGGAPARLQALRRRSLCPREQNRPPRPRRRQGPHRHRLLGKVVARHRPRPRPPRHRRRGGAAPRDHHLQGRHGLAPRHGELPRVVARPRAHHRRRGEAQAHRGADQGGDLRRPPRPPGHRLEEREGRDGLLGQAGARPGQDRPHPRLAPGPGRSRDRRAPRPPHGARRRRPRRQRRGDRHPQALVLLGLPAQHLDPAPRGRPRLCRHRVSLHGPLDGPRHRGIHPHGRRGRQLDRRGALLQPPPRLPEPRRRHLQPLRRAGDPRRARERGEHHLQDPLQRRRRHDRRPAQRGRPHRAADRERAASPWA